MAAFEEIALKIGTQPVADDRYVEIVDNMHQKLDLILCEKLRFIHDQTIVFAVLDFLHVQLFHGDAGVFESAARPDTAAAVPRIQRRFDQNRVFAALPIIVFDHDRVCGL